MRRPLVCSKPWVLQYRMQYFICKEVPELGLARAYQMAVLIRDGSDTAYMIRYACDVHGGLSPENIRKVFEAYWDARDLNAKVLSTMEDLIQKVEGTEEKEIVKSKLTLCQDLDEVFDIIEEYSPNAKKTKAKLAREFGMEVHAERILSGKFLEVRLHLRDGLDHTLFSELLIYSMADLLNRKPEVRSEALKIFTLNSECVIKICVSLTPEAAKKKQHNDAVKKEWDKPEREAVKGDNRNIKYTEDLKPPLSLDYEFECSYINYEHLLRDWLASPIKIVTGTGTANTEKKPDTEQEQTKPKRRIKDHIVSALIKATEEGILTWKVEVEESELKKFHPYFKKEVHPTTKGYFRKALSYSIKEHFKPLIKRGVKKYLTSRADYRGIHIFGHNVDQLFNRKGIESRYVIALDPGHMIKAAFLEPNGKVIEMKEFLIIGSTFDRYGQDVLKDWTRRTSGESIVFGIGNGKNSFNTQCAVSKMMDENSFPEEIDIGFCVVLEHGASKYSCTSAAQEEFGDDTEIRLISAVSIGRRLIDPMSEFVKIPPQHIGRGQYQLSNDEDKLQRKLRAVVRDRVSLNGVDVNTASRQLLENICGLDEEKAIKIINYRETKGRFRSREELKMVEGMDEITFRQCSGFLTVSRPESNSYSSNQCGSSSNRFVWSPFDETIVHPDDYEEAERLLNRLNMTVEDVRRTFQAKSYFKKSSDKVAFNLREALFGNHAQAIQLNEKEEEILNFLTAKSDMKPPPTIVKKVELLNHCKPDLQLDKLDVGSVYTGTVVNMTDMGIYVDFGWRDDGLIRTRMLPPKDEGEIPETLDDIKIDFDVGDQIEVVVQVFDKFSGKVELRLLKRTDSK